VDASHAEHFGRGRQGPLARGGKEESTAESRLFSDKPMTPELPDESFLDMVEREFDVLYPDTFRALLRAWRGGSARVPPLPSARSGRFVTAREVLIELNAAIGAEEWGDLERAVASKPSAKDGTRFWGGIVPFWFATSTRERKSSLGRRAGDIIVGFDVEAPMDDKVLVWSVHTVVHAYPDVLAWLGDNAGAKPRRG